MTKSEVLKSISRELDLTIAETEQLYDSFVNGMNTLLSNNVGFTLPGVGSFSTELRDAHKSYNPHYEQMMLIPPKNVIHFSQSSTLKDEINRDSDE